MPSIGSSASCIPCAPGYTAAIEPYSSPRYDLPYQARRRTRKVNAIVHRHGYRQFSATIGSENCTVCERGTYSEDVGASACQVCRSGGFCRDAGGASRLLWSPCRAGRYGTKDGAVSPADGCAPCPEGTANGLEGQSGVGACNACPSGTKADMGSSRCTPCAPLLLKCTMRGSMMGWGTVPFETVLSNIRTLVHGRSGWHLFECWRSCLRDHAAWLLVNCRQRTAPRVRRRQLLL